MADKPSLRELFTKWYEGDGPYQPNGLVTRFLREVVGLTEHQTKISKSKGQPCPMCGGVDRFRYDNKHGRGDWYCNQCGGTAGKGGGGIAWTLAVRLLGDKEAKDGLRAFMGGEVIQAPRIVAPPVSSGPSEAEAAEHARIRRSLVGLWDAGQLFSPEVASYYAVRGIPASVLREVQNVRFLPSLGYFIPNEDPDAPPVKVDSFPALIAQMQSAKGELVAIHRTWLSQDRRDKAPVPPGQSVKKLSQSLGASGGAIRLFDATGARVLGVTEGIETGLGVRALTSTGFFKELSGPVPVWACYSAGMLAAFEIPEELLPTLETLVVFADADESGVGLANANALKARIEERYPAIRVLILCPAVLDCDWLDVWRNQWL